MLDDIVFILGMVLIVLIILAAVIIPGLIISNFQCSQFGQQTEMQTTFRVLTGCYVQIDGRWVPQDSYWKYIKIEIAK